MRVNSLTMGLFWTAVIGFELWLLLNDINVLSRPAYVDESVPPGEKVAQLSTRQNTVQIQNGGDLVWSEIREGESLYDGQSLLTLGRSEAGIRFDDASEIVVAENSLIQIQRPPNEKTGEPLKLALLRGTIRKTVNRPASDAAVARKPARLEIAIGKQIAVIEGSGEFVARAPVSSTELPSLEVTSGNLSIQKAEGGERIELASGERLEISETDLREAPRAEETPLVVETPAPTATSEIAPEASPAPVARPTAAPAKKSAKRLPPPQLLNPPKIRKKPKASPAPTSPGAWLWRIFGISEAYAAQRPDPYAEETWEIELTWNPVPNAKAYVIQIAKDRSFKNLVQVDRTESPTYLWNYRFGMENSKGRVFYRVATENTDGRPGKFSPADIIVLPKREVLIAQKKAEEAPPKPAPAPPPAVPPSVLTPPSAWKRTVVALGPRMTSFAQSSGLRQLEEVKSASLFLHESLALRYESARANRLQEFSLVFDPARFEPSGTRHPNQTEEKTFALKLHAARWNEERYRRGQWSFGYGLLLDRAYRFEKKDLTRVELSPAYAAGGIVGLRQRTLGARGPWPAELRLQLEVPVTGLLMDAQYGARAEFGCEWDLSGTLGLALLGHAGMLKFDTPTETTVTTYGGALLFRYRHLAQKGMR